MLMPLVSFHEQMERSWACTSQRQFSPSPFSLFRKCDGRAAPRACAWQRPLLSRLMLTSRNWPLLNLRPCRPPTPPHPHIRTHTLTPTRRLALNKGTTIAFIPKFRSVTRSSRRRVGSGLSARRARLQFGRRHLLLTRKKKTKTTTCERITFTCRPRHRFPVICSPGVTLRGRPLSSKPWPLLPRGPGPSPTRSRSAGGGGVSRCKLPRGGHSGRERVGREAASGVQL